MLSSMIAYFFASTCFGLSCLGGYRMALDKDRGRELSSCGLIIAFAFAAYWLARLAEN